MFGIKTRGYNISALIFGILGVACLSLKVFKVLDDDIYTLLALVLLLFGFALYLRPKMKKMKVVSEILSMYREKLYTEITKKCKKSIDVKEVTFTQDNDFVMHCGEVAFENLTFEEFRKIAYELLKDFVIVCYSEDDEVIKNAPKAERKN